MCHKRDVTNQTPSSIADYGAGSTPINKPGETVVTSRIRAARDTTRNEGEVVLIHLCEEETWQAMVKVHCKSTALSKRYQVFNDLITLSQKTNYSKYSNNWMCTVCEWLSKYHAKTNPNFNCQLKMPFCNKERGECNSVWKTIYLSCKQMSITDNQTFLQYSINSNIWVNEQCVHQSEEWLSVNVKIPISILNQSLICNRDLGGISVGYTASSEPPHASHTLVQINPQFISKLSTRKYSAQILLSIDRMQMTIFLQEVKEALFWCKMLI